uniref:Uncharacterized protein n=1 Tax=Ectopseudomonas oleovorans TaxID=301 RepID=A0A653BCX8_ECTOL
MYSRLSGKSMAIARMEVPYAEQGAALEVKGSLAVKAIAHSLPFDDPEKKKRTARGEAAPRRGAVAGTAVQGQEQGRREVARPARTRSASWPG